MFTASVQPGLPRFTSRSPQLKPVAFGNSDALKLMREGNAQQAIINLVEDLKREGAKHPVKLEDVARVQLFLAKAFSQRLGQVMATDNQEDIQDTMWKLNVHALEANRLWSLIGRSDWKKNIPTSGVMAPTEDATGWAHNEMIKWFDGMGMTYLPETSTRFSLKA